MPLVDLTVQHGRTLAEARAQLEQTVAELQTRFSGFVQKIEWSPDRHAVKLTGPGVQVDLRVDAESIHVIGDVPLLGKLLGSPFVKGLKGIVEDKFQKRLTKS